MQHNKVICIQLKQQNSSKSRASWVLGEGEVSTFSTDLGFGSEKWFWANVTYTHIFLRYFLRNLLEDEQ